jgi:hypothetical protein
MNIICKSLGHQPTGQPVAFRIPNMKIEKKENRELDSRPQATGQEAIGSQYKDRNKENTGVKIFYILYELHEL